MIAKCQRVSMYMTGEEFIGKCILQMLADGITVQFNKRKNNSKYAFNFFDIDKEAKNRLVINYFYNPQEGDAYILETFIHEYCHYRQWKSNPVKWDIFDYHYNLLDDWLCHRSEVVPEESIRYIQKMESDCDRRVVRLVKKYQLPINLETYIKQSNAYILSYNMVLKQRKFFNFAAYNHEDILKNIEPKCYSMRQLMVLPVGYEEAFVKNSW